MRPSAFQRFSESSTADLLLGLASAAVLTATAFQICYPVLMSGDAATLVRAFRPASPPLVFMTTSMLLALVVWSDIPSRLQRCEPLRQQAELLVWSQFTFGLILMIAEPLSAIGKVGITVIVGGSALFITLAVILLVKQYRATTTAGETP